MDEPMSALDLGNQADILQLLMSIKSEGKTLLMVSHNPLHALSSNGTVCLLDDRHIFAYGPSNEILSDRNIKQIYGNKIKGLSQILCKHRNAVQIEQNLFKAEVAQAAAALFSK